MKNSAVTLFFLLLSLSGNSQANSDYELKCEVNRVLPYISITKQELSEAQTLIDLNPRFKSEWIQKYISVEISATGNGKPMKATSRNDLLTKKQKVLMNSADRNTDISVKIQYLPENTLKQNEVKEMTFSFILDPKTEAQYVGGEQELKRYLKKNIIDELAAGSIKKYDLAAVNFTVDEKGNVVDIRIFDTSMYGTKPAKTDEILMKAICNMPRWKPATYSDGTKVKQDFALTVGDHESCVVNILNIRRLPIE